MFFRKIFKAIRLIIVILFCIIVIANIYTISASLLFNNDLPKIFGFSHVIVVSGSMQPTINVGDMLIIQQQNSYETNDIITFRYEGSLVTHRIIEVNDAEVITKGDSNNTADGPTSVSDIEGKVVTRIPGIGNIILFLKTPLGILSMILGAIVLIEVPYIIEKRRLLKR